MRCNYCRKKTLCEYECKCLQKFCLNCLPFYIHNCSYDYKKERQNNLTESNPKIIAQKIQTV